MSGLGDVGDAMVRNVDVSKVTMTGSSPTARLIQAAGAETLTPAVFELGGKSPNIVLDDADLNSAVMGLTYASIYGFNAGQACVAGSRILVQRGVFEEVLQRIEGIAKSIVVGDPSDPGTSMGPLISQEQYEKVVAFIEDGIRKPNSCSVVATGPRWCRTVLEGIGSNPRCSWRRIIHPASATRRSSVPSAP